MSAGKRSLLDWLMVKVLVFLVVFGFVCGVGHGETYKKTDYSYRAMDIAALRGGFEKPPIEAGPWVYWFCFDNAITADEMEREIKEMVAAGLSGAEFRFVEFDWWREKEDVNRELAMVADHKRLEYLSDEFVDVLEHACSVAERYGFKLSINMGMGWPPGGTWITNEYRTRKLKPKVTIVEGPKEVGKDVKVRVSMDSRVFAWQLVDKKEKTVQAESFINLTGHVRFAGKEGGLFWKAPKGKWLVVVFTMGYGSGLDKAYGWAADPGSKEAIEFHLDYLFGKLEPKLGKYFGTTLIEAASDSWEYDGAPYWTPGMDDAFLKLHGYELAPRMYALAGYGEDREKITADVKRTQEQLVRDNFYIHARKILNAHGIGHRPQAYGRGMSRNLFEAYSNCDVPELEQGVNHPEAIWAAHTLGKPIVSVEGMTFMSRHFNNVISVVSGGERKDYGIEEPRGGWQTNPALLRWFSNAHYARGINRVQMHSFSYSPDGIPLPGWRMYAEIHLNRNVSWWKYMNQYGMWARRTQWLLQSGWPVADCLVYPVKSSYGDSHSNTPSEHQPSSAMNSVDAASSYTFSRIWESDHNRYEVKNLCLLSDIRTLPEAWKIDQMLKKGASLTYCGVEPDEWSLFKERKGKVVKMLLESIKKARRQGRVIDGREDGWRQVVKNSSSVRWYPEDGVLTYFHRRVEGAEVYFVMNCGEPFDGELEFREKGLIPQMWDADTGKVSDCAQWRVVDVNTRVKLQIGRLESALIVFVKGREALHVTKCQGAEIIRDENGRLHALVLANDKCRVVLSDGSVRNLKAKRPKAIGLDDGWTLSASDSDGVGLKGKAVVKLDKLKSWREFGEFRKYSGTASYHIAFEVNSEMLRDDLLVELDLGKVYEVAEVWLNDKRIGVSWYPPYRIDISGHLKQGTNKLRIDVANVLKNHLTEGENTHPSGLLGPVRIQGVSKIPLDE